MDALHPGTRAALDALLAQPDVEAVLLPVRPSGEGALARSARAYMDRWDARFVHRMTCYAPMARVATREGIARLPERAPRLLDAIDAGRRVEALPEHAALAPIAGDLGAWTRAWRSEGEAWGRLAARDARFAPFLPALARPGWWRHNVAQQGRRAIEVLEAVRRPAPAAWALHVAREAAFTEGCVRGYRSRSPF